MTPTTIFFVYLAGIPLIWSFLIIWKPGVAWYESADPVVCLAKAILWPISLPITILHVVYAFFR